MYRYGINLLLKEWSHYSMISFVSSMGQWVEVRYQLTHEIVVILQYDNLSELYGTMGRGRVSTYT